MRFLVTGASGLLGFYICKFFSNLGHDLICLYISNKIIINNVKQKQLNLLDTLKTEKFINSEHIDIIIHSAGLTNVDECEKNSEIAFLLHRDVSKMLAELSYRNNIYFIHISTDHLWDGKIHILLKKIM